MVNSWYKYFITLTVLVQPCCSVSQVLHLIQGFVANACCTMVRSDHWLIFLLISTNWRFHVHKLLQHQLPVFLSGSLLSRVKFRRVKLKHRPYLYHGYPVLRSDKSGFMVFVLIVGRGDDSGNHLNILPGQSVLSQICNKHFLLCHLSKANKTKVAITK